MTGLEAEFAKLEGDSVDDELEALKRSGHFRRRPRPKALCTAPDREQRRK